MKRTANGIEQAKESAAYTESTSPNNVKERPQNKHLKPWPKGVSGNPGGRKYDVAREIAQAVFAENKPAIYAAMLKALTGTSPSYSFEVLSNRAFGKLVEKSEVTTFTGVSDEDLDSRIKAMEVELGLAAAIDALPAPPQDGQSLGREPGNPA